MDTGRLRKYAQLVVRAGCNVQKGQLLIVTCSVDTAYFGRLVQEAAYDAGASEVRMDWIDDSTTRLMYLRAADNIFDYFPEWKVAKLKEQNSKDVVYLRIESSDPDLLAGVDASRIKRGTTVMRTAIKEHDELQMSNAFRWSLCAVPSQAWASKVFPEMRPDIAVDVLWSHILKGARADGTNPIADWERHKQNFTKRVSYLNEQNFSALRITTGLGTDFTMGLVKNHTWIGGGDFDHNGEYFFPNIPTEEIFTMPDRNRAEGKVVISRPLSYYGVLVEGIVLTFKDGEVVEYSAEKNYETLAGIIETDKGSRRLGEIALVANSSPISQMNTLFYNTLVDENASSHMALGRGYPTNIIGGEKMTNEEIAAMGGNDSILHVDFMFGTDDVRIVGIGQDGKETLFFEKGEYIEV